VEESLRSIRLALSAGIADGARRGFFRKTIPISSERRISLRSGRHGSPGL
jgi:hypothetical protein